MAAPPQVLKKGAAPRRRLCRRVVNERVLTFNAPNGAKVLRFDGPIGPRIVVSPLWGDEYIINVTCFPGK